MRKHQLYLDRRGALGEYGNIREIFAHKFEILFGRIAPTHELLDQIDIFLQILFWSWWSINTDNELVDIIVQSAILPFYWNF